MAVNKKIGIISLVVALAWLLVVVIVADLNTIMLLKAVEGWAGAVIIASNAVIVYNTSQKTKTGYSLALISVTTFIVGYHFLAWSAGKNETVIALALLLVSVAALAISMQSSTLTFRFRPARISCLLFLLFVIVGLGYGLLPEATFGKVSLFMLFAILLGFASLVAEEETITPT